jgi:hypothetical protein
MENNCQELIKMEDGLVLNIRNIRWIKKIHNCMYICSKDNGNNISTSHVICNYKDKKENEKTFEKFNIMFR